MMRLPKDQENWTSHHADLCLTNAWRKFYWYEARVDFTRPPETINDLYRPYQLARELAVQVANYTGWRAAEANALP